MEKPNYLRLAHAVDRVSELAHAMSLDSFSDAPRRPIDPTRLDREIAELRRELENWP